MPDSSKVEAIRVEVLKKAHAWENHYYIGIIYVHNEMRFATSGPTQRDVENQCEQWIKRKGGRHALASST